MPTISSRLDRLEQRAAPDQRQAQIEADAAWVVNRLRDLAGKAHPTTRWPKPEHAGLGGAGASQRTSNVCSLA